MIKVVDLLVSFATIAAKSPRKDVIFEPYPTIFDPLNPKKIILSDKNKVKIFFLSFNCIRISIY